MSSQLCFILLLIPFLGFTQKIDSETIKLDKDQLVKSVYFGGGSYYITPNQVKGIQEFFDKVEDINNYEVIISGHTDDIGGKEYNEWLSAMRGLSVKSHLLSMLVPEEIIYIKNFGQENPLYDNEKIQGKLRNRRVDIILAPIVY